MAILYGGIVFLRADASLLLKVAVFVLIALFTLSFFLLWARALAEVFSKYRLVAAAIPHLRRLSYFSGESDHVETTAPQRRSKVRAHQHRLIPEGCRREHVPRGLARHVGAGRRAEVRRRD